jgi:nucleoside-diphosphate-sugar epimerase
VSRVLLTGATGFVGRRVVAPLVAAGHEVHAVTSRPEHAEGDAVTWHRADLLASPDVVRDIAPDVLVHLAWYVEHGRFWTAPENVRWVEASLALLRAFAAAGGARAVMAGTCAEYDWRALEGACHEDRTPLRPATLYGAAKHALHTVGSRFAEAEGFGLAWGRIFFVYGPGEPRERLVPSVGAALIAGEEVPTTRGDQQRDFMHVRDVAAAFAALASSDVTGAVNVASGHSVTVRQMVDAIAAAAGRPELLRPGVLPTRAGDPALLVADVTRLRDEVGFTPSVPLTDGVADTLAWLQASERVR